MRESKREVLSPSLGRVVGSRATAAFLAVAVFGTSTASFAQAKKAAAPAAADKKAAKPGDKKAAGAAFKRGKDAFDKKDWAAAKEGFVEADEILPAAAAQYYAGRASEELGEAQEAVRFYEKALAGTGLKEELASDARARSEALKKKPSKVKITSEPAGATILVDGAAIAEKTPAEIDLAPGTHTITLKAEGRKDFEQSVEVAAFTGAAVTGTLEEAPPPPPPPVATAPETPPPAEPTPAPPEESTGERDMTWVYVTGVGAIVALGVGTFFGVRALGDKSKFNDAVAAGDRETAIDRRDAGTRNALISDMGFGIGITLAVTSAVLFFTKPSTEEAKTASSKPSFQFAPVVGGNSAGATALIRF
jgi:uncharacterized glyoxalase superfamily protein PhnB